MIRRPWLPAAFMGAVAIGFSAILLAQIYNFFPSPNSTITNHGVLVGSTSNAINSVSAMAADTVLQGQGASADPAAVAVNNCGDSTHGLSYSTSTHTFGCQSIVSATACSHGTATIAAGGFTGTANSHLFWEKCTDGTNSSVVLHIQVTGTSNATTFTVSGLNGLGIGPLNLQESPLFAALDNGTSVLACSIVSGDTVTFKIWTTGNPCSGTWTASGTKQVSASNQAIVVSYVLD